jgi:calcineurin-like phosphoesterase
MWSRWAIMPSTRRTCSGSSSSEPRILRPLNFAKGAPGAGRGLFCRPRGRKVLVAQVLGQVFMKRAFDDPFGGIERGAQGASAAAGRPRPSLVDVHCEATSEKMAMGHFCDGRASVVVGTHTHVPTADAMILPGGTAYLTDAGMCGDYNSVIGMEKAEPLRRFVTGMAKNRFSPAWARRRCRGSMSRPTTPPGRSRVEPWCARAGGWHPRGPA